MLNLFTKTKVVQLNQPDFMDSLYYKGRILSTYLNSQYFISGPKVGNNPEDDFTQQFLASHEFNLHTNIDVWTFPIPESLLYHEPLRICECLILLLEVGIFKKQALLL